MTVTSIVQGNFEWTCQAPATNVAESSGLQSASWWLTLFCHT